MKYVQMQKMEKFYIRLSIKNQVKYYKRENYEKENIENNFFYCGNQYRYCCEFNRESCPRLVPSPIIRNMTKL